MSTGKGKNMKTDMNVRLNHLSRFNRLSRVALPLCLAALLAASIAALAQSDSDDASRDSLRGLKGVRVDIGIPGKDAQKAGLDRAQMQTEVELRLRTAG